MALKPDRDFLQWDNSRFIGAITYGGDRGGVLVATGAVTNSPSGAAMDQASNSAWYCFDPSGYQPVGVLMSDVVNIDLTRQSLNFNKSEHQVGDKVPVLTKGWVVTNLIDPMTANSNITIGAPAYLTLSGYVSHRISGFYTDSVGFTRTAHPLVGKFLSKKDADGYAKVYIDL